MDGGNFQCTVYIDTYGDSDFNNFSYIHVFYLIILFFSFTIYLRQQKSDKLL